MAAEIVSAENGEQNKRAEFMTQTIVFKTHWEPFFRKHNLRTFDDFFEYADGNLINLNSKRNVIVLKLAGECQECTFFMKRFFNPHFKDMLAAFRHFGKLCSQAEVEWRNANILMDNGIETYHPVCYGVRTHYGLEQQSFFVTEQIKGPCLLDYLAESWGCLEADQRNDLVIRLGRFFRKIHSAQIRLPDAYIWHVYRVLSDGADGGFELGMIDLHRMQIHKSGQRSAAKDLGAFLFSLPDGFMDEPLRLLFMDSYLRNGPFQNPNAFRKQVKSWELKIAARRRREVETLTGSSISP